MLAFMLFAHKRHKQHHAHDHCENRRADQKDTSVHQASRRCFIISIVVVNHMSPPYPLCFFAAPRSPPRGKSPPLYFIQLVELCQPLFFCRANIFQQQSKPMISIFGVFIHIGISYCIQFFSYIPVDNLIAFLC